VRRERGGHVSIGELRLSIGETREPHDDAGSAETALARTGSCERFGPNRDQLWIETLESRDFATFDAPNGGYTRDARRAIDPNGATPALALRAATVFGRPDAKAIPEHLQKRGAVVLHHHRTAVYREADLCPDCAGWPDYSDCSDCAGWSVPLGTLSFRQLKEDPQPQVLVAFGFEMWNPASFNPSVYSSVEPFSN
jgi:hypothetical protein